MKQLFVLTLLLVGVLLAGCAGQTDDDHVEPWEADGSGDDYEGHDADVNDSVNDTDDSAIEADLDVLLNDFEEFDDEALLEDAEVEE